MDRLILFLFVMIGIFGCQAPKELTTVEAVDFERYAGTWYEIARLPNRFEEGLERVTATYTLKQDGSIEVLNQGVNAQGELQASKGKAYVPDIKEPGRLKVQFFWPFSGDYYIIDLDNDYEFALVGTPSRKYLWILARSRELPDTAKQYLIEQAVINGFDTEPLLFIKQ